MNPGRGYRMVAFAVVALLAVGLSIWASDRITLQGERTIYTVNCVQGEWQGARCTGKLVAGERYAFRASPLRREVIFWIRGSSEPSGLFANCEVVNRDNWACPPKEGQKPWITYQMKGGRPVRVEAPQGVAFHDVPKWKWWLLDLGIGSFSEALH